MLFALLLLFHPPSASGSSLKSSNAGLAVSSTASFAQDQDDVQGLSALHQVEKDILDGTWDPPHGPGPTSMRICTSEPVWTQAQCNFLGCCTFANGKCVGSESAQCPTFRIFQTLASSNDICERGSWSKDECAWMGCCTYKGGKCKSNHGSSACLSELTLPGNLVHGIEGCEEDNLTTTPKPGTRPVSQPTSDRATIAKVAAEAVSRVCGANLSSVELNEIAQAAIDVVDSINSSNETEPCDLNVSNKSSCPPRNEWLGTNGLTAEYFYWKDNSSLPKGCLSNYEDLGKHVPDVCCTISALSSSSGLLDFRKNGKGDPYQCAPNPAQPGAYERAFLGCLDGTPAFSEACVPKGLAMGKGYPMNETSAHASYLNGSPEECSCGNHGNCSPAVHYRGTGCIVALDYYKLEIHLGRHIIDPTVTFVKLSGSCECGKNGTTTSTSPSGETGTTTSTSPIGESGATITPTSTSPSGESGMTTTTTSTSPSGENGTTASTSPPPSSTILYSKNGTKGAPPTPCPTRTSTTVTTTDIPEVPLVKTSLKVKPAPCLSPVKPSVNHSDKLKTTTASPVNTTTASPVNTTVSEVYVENSRILANYSADKGIPFLRQNISDLVQTAARLR